MDLLLKQLILEKTILVMLKCDMTWREEDLIAASLLNELGERYLGYWHQNRVDMMDKMLDEGPVVWQAPQNPNVENIKFNKDFPILDESQVKDHDLILEYKSFWSLAGNYESLIKQYPNLLVLTANAGDKSTIFKFYKEVYDQNLDHAPNVIRRRKNRLNGTLDISLPKTWVKNV